MDGKKWEWLFLFPLHPTLQFDVVHQLHDRRRNTSTSANHMSRIFMFSFLSTRGILGILSCSGNPRFQWFFIFTAHHSDIFTWRFNCSMSSPIGARSVFRVFVGLTSALLCPTQFPAAESCSHFGFLLTLLLCSKKILNVLSSTLCGMSCFLPYQLTNRLKCILMSWPILLRTGIPKPTSDPKWKS